jgi:S1-C subfamily serine protease
VAPRAPREPVHIPWRPVAIAAATALVVIGVALGLNAIFGGGSSGKATAKAGWLGVRLGVLPTGAVVVTGVESGSPARSAGVQKGDVITEVQGRPVAAPVDVQLAVDALAAGDHMEIAALRGSHAYTAQVRLAARPSGATNRAGP